MVEAGNAEAQYRMGLFVITGKEVPQNTGEAMLWWRKAADQNYLPAQNDLGVAYSDGKIVPQDSAEGVGGRAKERSREKIRPAHFGDECPDGTKDSCEFTDLSDIMRARFRLGLAYWYGSGVQRDYAEAVKWYRKAAEQGDGLSQHELGQAYEQGKGVRGDYVLAHMWTNLSVVSGTRNAEQDRNRIAFHMTPKQIEEAEKLAREWRPSKQAPKLAHR